MAVFITRSWKAAYLKVAKNVKKLRYLFIRWGYCAQRACKINWQLVPYGVFSITGMETEMTGKKTAPPEIGVVVLGLMPLHLQLEEDLTDMKPLEIDMVKEVEVRMKGVEKCSTMHIRQELVLYWLLYI